MRAPLDEAQLLTLDESGLLAHLRELDARGHRHLAEEHLDAWLAARYLGHDGAPRQPLTPELVDRLRRRNLQVPRFSRDGGGTCR